MAKTTKNKYSSLEALIEESGVEGRGFGGRKQTSLIGVAWRRSLLKPLPLLGSPLILTNHCRGVPYFY